MMALAKAVAFLPYACLGIAVTLLDGVEHTLVMLTALLVHEAGHILILRLFGGRGRLSVSGMALSLSMHPNIPYPQYLCVVLAGSGFNIALGTASWWMSFRLGTSVFAQLCEANFIYATVNLLPIPTLDGERALGVLTALLAGEKHGRVICSVISIATLLITLLFSLYMINRTGVGIYLLFFSAVCLIKKQKAGN